MLENSFFGNINLILDYDLDLCLPIDSFRSIATTYKEKSASIHSSGTDISNLYFVLGYIAVSPLFDNTVKTVVLSQPWQKQYIVLR